jgi:hypothetical protein
VTGWGYVVSRFGLGCDRFGLSCDRFGLSCDRLGLPATSSFGKVISDHFMISDSSLNEATYLGLQSRVKL